MKRISALICELNPLHDGHRHIFSVASENSDILIAVMSGNFVQRGETAVYDKYTRAESALTAGANIVLELPFPFCSASAEFFARAGVAVAEGALVDTLYFGSESADITALKKAGRMLASDEYRKGMSVGRSAAMRGELLQRLCPELPESIYSSPNDILGAEYCRWASIDTVAVKRILTDSASVIRERSLKKENCDMLDPKRLKELLFYFFRMTRCFEGDIAECSGGVLERLSKCAFSSKNACEWEQKCRTKQYTNARLRRAALFAMCSVMKSDIRESPQYTQLLGADEKGREYLKSIRKNAAINIITNPSDSKKLPDTAQKQYELSTFADSIYSLCQDNGETEKFGSKKPIMK